MDDAPHVARALLGEDVEGVGGGLPRVCTTMGFSVLAGEGNQAAEGGLLHLARGAQVVVVEANLAHGDDLGVGTSRSSSSKVASSSDLASWGWTPTTAWQSPRRAARAMAWRAGSKKLGPTPTTTSSTHALRVRPLDGRVRALGEVVRVQVTVRIDEHGQVTSSA